MPPGPTLFFFAQSHDWTQTDDISWYTWAKSNNFLNYAQVLGSYLKSRCPVWLLSSAPRLWMPSCGVILQYIVHSSCQDGLRDVFALRQTSGALAVANFFSSLHTFAGRLVPLTAVQYLPKEASEADKKDFISVFEKLWTQNSFSDLLSIDRSIGKWIGTESQIKWSQQDSTVL